jgi:hypothetical protein
MRKGDLYDASGRFLRTLTDGEENYIVKDGESLRFPMSMMDSMDPLQRAILQDSMTPSAPLHAPGQVRIADSEIERRETLVANDKARLSDAWKNPPVIEPVKPAITPGAIDARESAYDRRDSALTNAWRHA